MENIEDKLKSYRVNKIRRRKLNRFIENVKTFFPFRIRENNGNHQPTVALHTPENNVEKTVESSIGVEVNNGTEMASAERSIVKNNCIDSDNILLKYTVRMLCVAFWITLYIIAIELQFGTIFLMISALAAIYLNTRTGPKTCNEISAYSVFNRNCMSIDGTLKGEQFEREMGFRYKS